MHTYRPFNEGGKFGFRVGTEGSQGFNPTGPFMEDEADAAAFCSFMNGGKYEPAAVEALMKPAAEERKKALKEREAAAKVEEEQEKARELAAHPPAPVEPAADQNMLDPRTVAAEEEAEKKPQRRPHAHAATRKHEVKRAKVGRRPTRHK
jgi:hypothetical protein